MLYSQEEEIDILRGLYSLKGNEKILDVGCGEGSNALKLAKAVSKGSVVGVEFSLAAIEEAKQKHLQAPSHLSFKYKELGKLQFSDKFDVVTCLSAKQLTFNQEDLLKQIHPLLKSKGHLIIAIPARVPVALDSAIKAVITSDQWEEYFVTFYPKWNLLKKEEYRTLLANMHFEVIEMKSHSLEEVFTSLASFKEYIAIWLPYLQAVPKNLQEAFIEDVSQRYLKIFPKDAKGNMHFLVEKLEIVAQKNK
jgi:trans-aconitate methyltransferase